MLKTHVIHVIVDGTNQQNVEQFKGLVDKFVNSVEVDHAHGITFCTAPMSNRTAVAMSAFIVYRDSAPAVV